VLRGWRQWLNRIAIVVTGRRGLGLAAQERPDTRVRFPTALQSILAESMEKAMSTSSTEWLTKTQQWTRVALERIGELEVALEAIATPMRPDGTWNRDREACRQLAQDALDGK